jgi:hypothetical protein
MGAIFRWIRELWLGRKLLGQTVERATAVIAIGTHHLFTVTGGRIVVTQILGEITTGMQAIATTLQLQSDPDTGTTRALCVALDVNAYAEGDLLGITGINTDTMIPPATAGSIEAQLVGVIVQEGTIDLIAGANNTGSVKWILKYIPLDDGAVVTAA